MSLCFPEFDYKFKESNGKRFIFDHFRKKYVVLNPEEWVRQHLVHYLVSHKGFPKTLISLERGLTYENQRKRSDVLVFDQAHHPLVLIECKKTDVALSQQVVDQVFRYNMAIAAPWVAITNGLELMTFKIESKKATLVSELPDYQLL